jgi:hypothetical protein
LLLLHYCVAVAAVVAVEVATAVGAASQSAVADLWWQIDARQTIRCNGDIANRFGGRPLAKIFDGRRLKLKRVYIETLGDGFIEVVKANLDKWPNINVPVNFENKRCLFWFALRL